MNRRWVPILPGLRSHYTPQSISDQGADPGTLDFCPRGVGVVEIWKDVCTGDVFQSSPGAA